MIKKVNKLCQLLIQPINKHYQVEEKRLHYKQALSTLHILKETYINHDTFNEPKHYLHAVNYFMGIVRKDFVTSVNASELLYGKTQYENVLSYFPFRLIMEQQSASEIFENGIEVTLTKDTISIPWRVERLYNIVQHLEHTPFHYDPLNHYSFYLEEFDLLIVWNGRHSMFYGSHARLNAPIRTQTIHLGDTLEAIDMDGAYWFMRKDGNQSSERIPVIDVRAAILFVYAKEIQKIKILYPSL